MATTALRVSSPTLWICEAGRMNPDDPVSGSSATFEIINDNRTTRSTFLSCFVLLCDVTVYHQPGLTYRVRVGNLCSPEGPVITSPGCRVEDLGRAAHSVTSAHGSGSNISQPPQLVLSGVVQSVVAPTINVIFSNVPKYKGHVRTRDRGTSARSCGESGTSRCWTCGRG